MTKVEKGFIAKISLIMATRMLGLFMILPVFSILGKNYEHSSNWLIGLAIGIYGLTQAILQIPYGYLSDKFGRKPLLILGLTLFLIGGLIAATTNNIYLVILGRFISGAGAIASVLMAFIADIVVSENRSKANAMIGMQIGLAFMLAIVIGPELANNFGINGIFYLTSILAFIAIIIVFTLPKSKISTGYKFSLVNVKEILVSKLLVFNFNIFVLHFILTSIFIIIPLQLGELNNSLNYFIVMSISFAIMIPFLILAENKNKHRAVLILSVILLLISQFLFYLDLDSYKLILFLTLFFIAFNIMESLLPSIIARWSDKNNPKKRGLIMSFYTTSQFLGAFSGGIIAGLLSQNFGNSSVFILNIALSGILFLTFFWRKVWQE